MKRVVQRILIGITALCFLFTGIGMEEAYASGEKIYFGSEEYEWELDMESSCFLGVYASADGKLKSIDLYVIYDPEMLEYVSGGELVEPGKIRVHSQEIEDFEFKRMLSFEPLLGGNTVVYIEDASVAEEGSESAFLPDINVPVNIVIPSGCGLDGMTINGTPIGGFKTDITEYNLIMTDYTEHADISLLPEDIDAEISGADLLEGENEIYIITTNSEGLQARYTLHVRCPENVISAAEAEEAETQPEKADPEPEENEDTIHSFIVRCMDYMKDMLINHKIWSAATGLLIILFILLLVIKKRMELERKRERRERERRREKRLREEARLEERRLESEIEEDVCEEKAIRIDIDIQETIPGIRKKDQITGPSKIDLEEAAKDETIFEAVSMTEEDLAEALDYLEEDEIVINVSHVTIDFKRDSDESGSVKELMIRTLTGQRSVTEFRALDDVSFTIMKGEVVGIIGTNGSGKSTILKIISGVLAPTKGSVKVDRQKIQLLTLGTGFDMELTGRENVYLNGAIIGYTKEYIDEKYDDIVEFAELQGFMEEKVKNYSSGMVSRLGFAIATVQIGRAHV